MARNESAPFPSSVREAIDQGFHEHWDFAHRFDSSGGTGGFQIIEGELPLVKGTDDQPSIVVPFKAKLEFGRPRPLEPGETF